MTTNYAVKQLRELDTSLTEDCHYQADVIVLEYLYSIGETDVAEAYEKVRKEAGFLYV